LVQCIKFKDQSEKTQLGEMNNMLTASVAFAFIHICFSFSAGMHAEQKASVLLNPQRGEVKTRNRLLRVNSMETVACVLFKGQKIF